MTKASYPPPKVCWSPAGGRIYFTQVHDGFECIFTRSDSAGMLPGSFRISVAQDKMTFALGEQVHQLLQWKP